MKKITQTLIAVTLLTLGVSQQAQAQYWSVGITGGVGLPLGDFGAKPTLDVSGPNNSKITGTADLGYGFGIQGRYHFNDNWAVGMNIGYLTFPGQPFDNSLAGDNEGTFDVVPVMAAVDYYFLTEAFRPYVGLELGYLATDLKWKTTGTNELSATTGGFALAPVLGFVYNFTDHFGLLFNVKYMYGVTDHAFDINKYNANSTDIGLPATQYLGVNLGVNFTFGN